MREYPFATTQYFYQLPSEMSTFIFQRITVSVIPHSEEGNKPDRDIGETHGAATRILWVSEILLSGLNLFPPFSVQ